MEWQAIHVTTQSEAVEAVSDLLVTLGAEGVEIEDAADREHFEPSPTAVLLDWNTIDHRQEGAVVTAYFPLETAQLVETVQTHLASLAEFGVNVAPATVAVSQIADEDWENTWKQYYQAARLTRHFTVVPAWMDFTPQQIDEKPLILDPGMAFGTGAHPTTQLMLQALEITVRGGETMLDVGTGSGILSIAAKHLGVETILATDIDEMAVRVAQENLDLNPIAADVQLQVSDLLADVKLAQPVDLIVANILADVIELLIPQTLPALRDGGYFLVSGIIAQNAPAIKAQLLAHDYSVEQELIMGDWHAFIARKPVLE